jgi:hypothetical protein
MTKTTLILLILLITTRSFGQTNKKVSNNEKSQSPIGIVGTWRLIEFSDLDSATNTWTHPYGRNPKGFFSYSKNGTVNINISSEIPLQIPKDSLNSYKIGIMTFRRKYALGYFGTYTVDKENGMVIHHVTGGTIPEYINSDQRRPYILKNDTLTIGDKKTWKRVLIRVD